MHKILLSSDGSLNAFNAEFGECYSSLSEGAFSEKIAKHIAPAFLFLESRLKSKLDFSLPKSGTKNIWILDICFGLGYNAILSAWAFERLLQTLFFDAKNINQTSNLEDKKESQKVKNHTHKNLKLHIVSLEKDKTSLDLSRDIFCVDCSVWENLARGKSSKITPNANLQIIWGDACETLQNLAQKMSQNLAQNLAQKLAQNPTQNLAQDFIKQYSRQNLKQDLKNCACVENGIFADDFCGFDIIYQDPFSFGKNPALWSLEHFGRLFALAKNDCIITSYATRKEVIKTAQNVGFLAGKFDFQNLQNEAQKAWQKDLQTHLQKGLKHHLAGFERTPNRAKKRRESSIFSKNEFCLASFGNLAIHAKTPSQNPNKKENRMKIVFMGTPIFANIAFDSMRTEIAKCSAQKSPKNSKNVKCEILCVVTQCDKPVGRKGVITAPPMKQKALENSIEVLQPDRLDFAFAQKLRGLKPDFIVVVAYGKILPKEILEIAPCINLHASILPKYRGASPIQQMILSDDSEYGISIMRMEEGLDSGGILGVAKIPRNDENYTDLSARLAHLGGAELARVLIDFGDIVPILQDESKASYCKKISKNDGEVRFINAQEIYKKSLAFSPWPSVFLPNGIKIFGIKSVANAGKSEGEASIQAKSSRAGEILSIAPLVVACENGAVEIAELQAPSKNKTNASDFIKSRGIKIGDNLLEI